MAAHPKVDAAIDEALAAAGFEVVDVDPEGWNAAAAAAAAVIAAEAWVSVGRLLARRDLLGPDVATRLENGRPGGAARGPDADAARKAWSRRLAAMLAPVDFLALPTMIDFPPHLHDLGRVFRIRRTEVVNLAGVPALSLPVPVRGGSSLPASLQLVGRHGTEELLLAAGLAVEAGIGAPGRGGR